MNLDVLRDELRRQPFEPFTVRLADGRALNVRHPDFVAVTPRRVVIIDENDEHMYILEPLLILSIDKRFSLASMTPLAPANGEAPP